MARITISVKLEDFPLRKESYEAVGNSLKTSLSRAIIKALDEQADALPDSLDIETEWDLAYPAEQSVRLH